MSAPGSGAGRLRAVFGVAALLTLGGCATFGGNVKGSFSCAAPDGICAPSSSIDDRALAMISGDSGGEASPAGPYLDNRPKAKAARTALAGQRVAVAQSDPRRTQERVLRIVFQPYIDERGRLHEASAVHAVVQSGEWQQEALVSATPIPDRRAGATPAQALSLAEALDRADPPGAQLSALDPDLPDPAAVAAARARKDDPVGTIKSEVAARLAPRAGRTPPASGVAPAPVARGMQQKTSDAATGAAIARGANGTGEAVSGLRPSPAGSFAGSPTIPSVPKTGSAAEATARVKADLQVQSRADEDQKAAKSAAASAGAADPPGEPKPVVKPPVIKPTVRAAGFPGAVPEEE